MKKISPEVQAYLENSHKSYCDFNQQERSDCALMVAKGHPHAAVYRELRGFFDSLRYACNSAARRFTHKDAYERSEYWAPSLDISWYPSGDALAKFGHIYPAHDRWEEYIEAAAEAGWPEGAGAKLEGGTWLIRTQNNDLRLAFEALRDKVIPTARLAIKTEVEEGTQTAFYRIEITLYDVKTALKAHKKIVSLLKKFQKAYVLPLRTDEQNKADTAPVPLSEKKFTLANVKEVTVTDRHVLVPLVALPVDEATVLRHSDTLLSLVEQGLPFAPVAEWLKGFLTPECFSELQAKYQ